MPIPHLEYAPDDPDEPRSLTVIISGRPLTLTSNDLGYERALSRVLAGAPEDEVRGLFMPAQVIGDKVTQLSPHVTFDGSNIFYDHDPLDSGIARHLVRVLRSGAGDPGAYLPTVRFLEKLYQNPSARSREQLYEFLRRFDFTITPDGEFIAYKGTKADFTSIHAGPGIVDGVRMEGHLPNHPGSVLEIARSYVNADPDRGCSTGLHVGTYGYAARFAQGGLLTVVVDPRDVVSVPSDCSFQKVRVCRYRVLETTEVEYTAPLWVFDDDDED